MQSSRMISCLLLLQGKRRMTARELAGMLEVSTRTVYRDVEALGAAGVPIHMERGALGGIVLADDYRRALAQFSTGELQSLFASGPGPFADLGMATPTAALQKLAGALPAMQRRAAESSRDRLFMDHNRWSRGEQPTGVLVALRKAAEGDRRVRMQYRDRSGTATDRVIDPLGLVAKAGVWYAIAREGDKGYRTFRAQRIQRVDVLAETFVRPSDFALEAYWNESVSTIERQTQETFDVVLRVENDALPKVSSFWEHAVLAEDDTSTTLRVGFPSQDVALMQILVLGASALEILSPPGIAAAIVARAADAIERYGSSANAIVMPASANPK
jgi:predicted DNA-binding transcriptional regulator YafY